MSNFLLLTTIILMMILSGCFTSTFNRLGHEETLIYENDDQTKN